MTNRAKTASKAKSNTKTKTKTKTGVKGGGLDADLVWATNLLEVGRGGGEERGRMKPGPGNGPGSRRAYYFEVDIRLGRYVAEVVFVPADSVDMNDSSRAAVKATAQEERSREGVGGGLGGRVWGGGGTLPSPFCWIRAPAVPPSQLRWGATAGLASAGPQ